MSDFGDKCAGLLGELGIARADEIRKVTPLTGGVASDIARVDLADRAICVKFALPKLKVAADWRAPVHRNAAEYAWLQVAAKVCPAASVALFGRSEALHGFAMEYVAGADVYLWKQALLEEAPDRGEAGAVGDMLGRIHRASAARGFDRTAFDNRDDFRALRIEPYLTYTTGTHPDLADRFAALEDMLFQADAVLVHGDVSPKNILMRGAGPVMLDAECATMGDASFDLAFCLNHLVLKAVHLPGSRDGLLARAGRFWAAYAAHVDWEDSAALEARVCALLPGLMLGRVDGKSPVEYLREDEQEFVRAAGRDLMGDPALTLARFADRLKDRMKGMTQ